ncbi:hypothetical protein Hte_008393 [Hypoxylon texense]
MPPPTVPTTTTLAASFDVPSSVPTPRVTMTTLSTAVKRQAMTTIFESPSVSTPTVSPPTTSLSSSLVAPIIVSVVAFVIILLASIYFIRNRSRRSRRLEKKEEAEKEAEKAEKAKEKAARNKNNASAGAAGGGGGGPAGNAAGEHAGDSSGSLAVPGEGDDGHHLWPVPSHSSRGRRASHSAAPPRGARHAGATGMATSGMAMSSSGGGGGGGASHH